MFEVLGNPSNIFLLLRSLYLKQFKNEKQIKSKLKSIHPTTEFLFGGKVFDLFKDLNATATVNNFGNNFLMRNNKRKANWNQSGGFNQFGNWNQASSSKRPRGGGAGRGGFPRGGSGRGGYRGGRGGSKGSGGGTLENFLNWIYSYNSINLSF